MRRLILTVVVAAAAATLTAQDKPRVVYGKLEKNETWSGKILVESDVEVPKDMTLTILPGTDIQVAHRDKRSSGWSAARVEIHVIGLLRVLGTEDKPVVFRAAGGSNGLSVTWHGIVLRPSEPKGKRSTIASARISNAFAGIQVPFAGPAIQDTVFLECDVGVEVGSAHRDASSEGCRSGFAGPELRRCRFAECKTGVYCEGYGSPDVLNSVFYKCQAAVGNTRPGVTSSLFDPGAIVERCAFVHNGSGVVGQSLVRDSIFVGNNVGMRLSNFHQRYSTEIDHVAMRSNLFHQNDRVVYGDTGLDNDPASGDPLFAGPLEALGKPGPALPPCLKLGAQSPARKRATDGGDLGPLGKGGGKRNEASWTPKGAVVGEAFALPGDMGGAQPQSLIRSRPNAGRKVSKTWWIRSAPDSSGVFQLADVFGTKVKEGWFAFTARARKKGTVPLEINGDVSRVGIYVNGQPSKSTIGARRRYGTGGLLVDVEVKSGNNVFFLKVEAWGRRPRLGLSFPEGMTPVKPKPPKQASIKITKARLVTRKDERYIDLTMSAALSWADTGRAGLFEIKDASGKLAEFQERIDVTVTGIRTLRLTRVSDRWQKPLHITLNGLRGAKGEVFGKTPVYVIK